MRKLIEYTLLSADGVFENPQSWGAMGFRDDAYIADGLGQLLACEAMLMGRSNYESFSRIWPGRDHPWSGRLNGMKKYVFSSKLEQADWANSTILRADPVAAIAELKQEPGGDLLIWGHGLLAETLWNAGLVDQLDLSIHPVLVGRGRLFFREGLAAKLELATTKSFSRIVKLTYLPRY